MSRKTIAPIATGVLLAMAAAAPLAAHAESNFVTGGGTLNAQARVDFQITIPQVLFLQVGTGALLTNDGTIDLIEFVVPALDVGSGNPVAATLGSGDLGNGRVTAAVRGNGGNVTLAAATVGALGNGAGASINWTEISTILSSGTLPVIPLPNSGAASTTLNAVAGVVDQSAQWTYSYDNSDVVPAGTYGGVNTNNSRVTYTASMP